MSQVTLIDKTFDLYLSSEKIQERIKEIGELINRDYKDKDLVLLGILNGSYRFIADLSNYLDLDVEVEFAKVSSYEGVESTGMVKTFFLPSDRLEGKHVLIVEDIVDTGLTLDHLMNNIELFSVRSLKVLTLLYKPRQYQGSHKVDYSGFEIPNDFVVGYGLDYDEKGRHLNAIYKLSNKKEMLNLVLFGPPGAGKGTQSAKLIDKYNLVHLSTGDIFRYNIKNETELGTLAKSYMDQGDLVPDEVTIKMLDAELDKHADANGFIFDGFPRTEAQAGALDELLNSRSTSISKMVALEVEEGELKTRLMERAKTSGRPDDADPDIIQNRINVYNDQTAPVAQFYRAQDKFFSINGIGSIDEIQERICGVIDQ
ncbi:MAG: adenylate kinase [Flavobacteriales bacterium]|nr:adenylate kinase [Flavobacteriales bacterium]